ALGVGAGLAGGPAGAGAGLLVDAGYQYNRTGVVLGEDRDKLAADLWNNAWTGALGGVVGGAIDAADAARTAVSAGLPYPAALQHGVPDSALRWPQSWVSRLGESGTVHADRLAAAEQLAALPPGSPEHDLLSEQIAYVNTLAHKRINLLTDVDLGQRLASYPHEARANHRSLLAELDAVSTALAPAHSGSAGPFGIRDQAGTGLSDRQVVQAVNDRYGRIVVRELRDLDGYQRALGRASEAYDLLSRIPPGVTAVLRTERGQTAAVWVTNAHGSITDIAAAATRPVPAVSPVDAAAATLLLFAPDGTVIPAAVELPPRAGPFSGPEPAAPLPLIWPSGSGGYLPPLPRQQDALACSLLQPDGFYEVGADPSRHIYHKLVNPDGIHRPSGRATNCVDSALAALSSFYGRPQVAPVQVRSELTTPWVELGERRGRSRQARWLRGEWQVADRPPAPGAIAHRAHFNQKYEELHKEIDRQGPLAAALVSVDWCYSNRYGAMVDQNGWTRGPDGMHAFVVVFPREAAGPVWWDPQSGRTWNHPPAHYAAVTHRLRYLRIQNDP
ncbi:MAG: hypothetical protein HOQ24_10660, partial [Mycobacteriaceae bacterium]|nr:hypothetical protein [Mycobacteriaceae bacterium]